MVYVQPSLLGWRPVMVSWLDTLPGGHRDAGSRSPRCLTGLLPRARVATKICKMPQPMQEINLLSRPCASTSPRRVQGAREHRVDEALVSVWIDSLFLFRSFGRSARAPTRGRAKFDCT